MVADNDHRSLSGEVFLALDDDEAHPRAVAHDEVEGAGSGPLAEAVFAYRAEGEGGVNAVGGAEEEGGVGGEEARYEA